MNAKGSAICFEAFGAVVHWRGQAEPGNEIALTIYAIGALLFLVALIALMIVKSRRWNVALLVVLIVLLPVISSIETLV